MKIKSIYIDGLHNTNNATYDLNDLTYFYGRNGSGKSTILNAIQFALLGYIPGTPKTKVGLLRHSNSGKITTKLTLCDGDDIVEITRILTDNLSSFTIIPEGYDLASIVEDIELPIFNFNEFVGQTANKLKEYFIKHILPVSDGNIQWTALLTDAVKNIHTENKAALLSKWINKMSSLEGSPLDQAVAANNLFKEEKSACDAELKSLQGAIDSLIFYDDYVGTTDLEELDNKISETNLLRDCVVAYKTAQIQSDNVLKELYDAQQQKEQILTTGTIEELTNERNDIMSSSITLSAKIKEYEDKIRQINSEIQAKERIVNSGGICQYTGQKCKEISDMLVQFNADINDLKEKLTTLQNDKKTLTDEYAVQTTRFNTVSDTINNYTKLSDKIAQLTALSITLPIKPNTDKTDIELAQEIKMLQDDRAKVIANQKYNETIDDLTAKKSMLELELSMIKAWVKATDTNTLQTQIMQKPFQELANRMTEYIRTMYGRDDITANFVVSEKANSFSFGLTRGNQYISYDLLSSGEKCLYAIALMICIVDNSNSPLKVLMLDDSLDNLDDVAIESTFESLKNIQGIQFIMAGVKHCTSAESTIIKIGS